MDPGRLAGLLREIRRRMAALLWQVNVYMREVGKARRATLAGLYRGVPPDETAATVRSALSLPAYRH